MTKVITEILLVFRNQYTFKCPEKSLHDLLLGNIFLEPFEKGSIFLFSPCIGKNMEGLNNAHLESQN